MPEVPAVVTQAKTLAEAHARVRSALSLFRDDAADVVLLGQTVWPEYVDFGLSESALQAIKIETELRLRSLDTEAQLERATYQAVRQLMGQVGQTYRAAGLLLGISHQRVEQIAKSLALKE
jgi:hypothetical protein